MVLRKSTTILHFGGGALDNRRQFYTLGVVLPRIIDISIPWGWCSQESMAALNLKNGCSQRHARPPPSIQPPLLTPIDKCRAAGTLLLLLPLLLFPHLPPLLLSFNSFLSFFAFCFSRESLPQRARKSGALKSPVTSGAGFTSCPVCLHIWCKQLGSREVGLSS